MPIICVFIHRNADKHHDLHLLSRNALLCIDDLLNSIAFDSGVGISSAAVLKAEIGRVERFESPLSDQVCHHSLWIVRCSRLRSQTLSTMFGIGGSPTIDSGS